MKTLFKYLTAICFGTLIFPTSCHKTDSAPTTTKGLLVGQWNVYGDAEDNKGNGILDSNQITTLNSQKISVTITFNSDGTGSEHDVRYSYSPPIVANAMLNWQLDTTAGNLTFSSVTWHIDQLTLSKLILSRPNGVHGPIMWTILTR